MNSSPSKAPTALAPSPTDTAESIGAVRFNPRGIATVVLDGPEPRTLRLSRKEARPLLDGDRVKCTGTGDNRVITLISRCRTIVVGVVVASDRGPVLEIDPATGSAWVTLPKNAPALGTALAVEIKPELTARVKATRVVAGPWPAGSIPHLRTAALLRTVGRYPSESPLADAEMVHSRLLAALTSRTPNITASPTTPGSHRADLRHLEFVTIDGPSTRDIDDAVWAAPKGSGWEVKVAIADVATAVPAGSELDAWALAAATSVYLPGETHPMLPPALSENLCSLLPGVDRDTLVASFTVSAIGEVSEISLTLATINSRARLTYDQVDEFLATGAAPGVPAVVAHCAAAAFTLGSAREERSELPEMITPLLVEPAVDGNDVVVELTNSATPAHKLIEHLMVAANEAVGVFIAEHGSSALYRKQSGPAADPLVSELATIASLWSEGADLIADEGGEHEGELTAADVAALLADLPLDAALAGSSRVLRHLGRAFYGSGPGQHFHLGATHYLHFTSPIRRYADLVVHRIIHAILAGDKMPYTDAELADLGEWITARSAAADWAESGCQRSLWAVLLDERARAGDPITALGTISNIDRSAMMLRLSRFGVVCRLQGSAFPRFEASPEGLSASIGAGESVRVGETVAVRITAADLLSGDLTVALAHPDTIHTDPVSLSASGSGTGESVKSGQENRTRGHNNRAGGKSHAAAPHGQRPAATGSADRKQTSKDGAKAADNTGSTHRSRRGRRPRPGAATNPA
jgi:ribonuclease R